MSCIPFQFESESVEQHKQHMVHNLHFIIYKDTHVNI